MADEGKIKIYGQLVAKTEAGVLATTADIIDDTKNKKLDAVLDDKQDLLISGSNIKTINNQSLLGEGDIDLSVQTASDLEIDRLFRTEYTLKKNISYGTVVGPDSIWTDETTLVTFTPSEGYTFPDVISVSGAQYSYDWATGEIVLTNVTGNVLITIVCIPN